jgi:hypothetical protein
VETAQYLRAGNRRFPRYHRCICLALSLALKKDLLTLRIAILSVTG